MIELAKQIASIGGATFAALCCAGVTAALSVFTAVGAGFLVNDAFLIALYVAMVALSVWLLYRSARAHGILKSFWVGGVGGVMALSGFLLTLWLVYIGLALLVAGSMWDYLSARSRPACAGQ